MKEFFAFLKNRHVVLLFVLAALLRLVYVFSLEDRWYYFDTAHYDSAARALLQNGTFGESLHYYDEYEHYCLEPAYPLFLAAIYGIFGPSLLAVRIAQVILSLLHLFVIHKMTQLLRPRAAILALVIGAAYPFFIYISGLLYVTQLFALLLTLSIYWFLKYKNNVSLRPLMLSAIVLAIAVVARPVALPIPILLAMWIFLFADLSWSKKIVHVLLTAVCLILILTPWTIRNWQVFDIVSPGRACLAETRVFEKVDLEFRIQDSQELTELPWQTFQVDVIDSAGATIFACFVDDTLMAKLKVNEEFSRPDSAYAGIIFKGGPPMVIDRVQCAQEHDIRLDSQGMHNVKSAPAISFNENVIQLSESESGWRHVAVFDSAISANTFRLFYPKFLKPQDASRVAILFDVNRPFLNADGYMIWLHPWLQADMWKVENGRPARPVETIDLFVKENPPSLTNLVTKKPLRFLTGHVLPEFLNFWSPVVSRVTTTGNVGGAMNLISILVFTPVLLFALIGLFLLRHEWKSLLIMLIPVLTISGAYSVFFTELRYRIPLDGFLLVLAVIGFDSILRRFQR